MVLFGRAVIKMTERGRYENLKTIFLKAVQRATERWGDMSSFEKVVAVDKAKGVDVYTRMNNSLKHKIEFPKPVEKWDLRTGKFPDESPADWVFDAYTERREPPQYDMRDIVMFLSVKCFRCRQYVFTATRLRRRLRLLRTYVRDFAEHHQTCRKLPAASTNVDTDQLVDRDFGRDPSH